jgi:hypothetical protein
MERLRWKEDLGVELRVIFKLFVLNRIVNRWIGFNSHSLGPSDKPRKIHEISGSVKDGYFFIMQAAPNVLCRVVGAAFTQWDLRLTALSTFSSSTVQGHLEGSGTVEPSSWE